MYNQPFSNCINKSSHLMYITLPISILRKVICKKKGNYYCGFLLVHHLLYSKSSENVNSIWVTLQDFYVKARALLDIPKFYSKIHPKWCDFYQPFDKCHITCHIIWDANGIKFCDIYHYSKLVVISNCYKVIHQEW